ncbi:MAG: acyltransferase [Butyrivibrio sp.]|nr:acyltransferase [Butyrivibrio sp.]
MFSIINKYFTHKKLSKVDKGNNVYIDKTVEIFAPELLHIEDNVHIQFGCKLFADGGGITIGEGTIFAHDVQVMARNHYYDSEDLQYIPYDNRFINKSVVIGKYCWIGARATILPGAKIGNGVVVGAGAVVAGEIEDCAICVGNPAKVIKHRNKEVFDSLAGEGKGYIANTKKY